MLQNDLTKEKYGYGVENLSRGSNKTICVICDYCDKHYTTIMKRRTKANAIVDKDSCKDCKFKKREDVSMAKYGVKNSSQKPEVRKKISDANSDRLKSEEFKQQAKQTNLRKYGSTSAMQNEDIKRKHKEVFLQKYGVENPSMVEEFRQKRMNTCKERFGYEYASQSDKGKQLIKDGFQRKYGVDNAFQNEDVKIKIKEVTQERYGVDHHMQRPGVATEVQKKGLETKIKQGDVKVYNNDTYPVIAKSIGFSSSHFYTLVKKYGIEKSITLVPHQSSLEVQMQILLDEIDIKYQKQFRVGRKIADFFIPSHNLIIETDGLYWHSDAILTDKNYHVDKRQLYIDEGYAPLFFREDELNKKMDVVKSILFGKFGMTQKVGARKCETTVLNKKDGQDFMKLNHLMGKGRGTYFSLSYDNKPVAVMCIKRLKDKDYEISRFCSVINYTIQGAFSKLLKFAKQELQMDSLTTFIDLRYGSGSYLKDFGFQQVSCHPSFKWTDSKDTFHRMTFPSNSGYDKGMVKIWDCGQAKHLLVLDRS